MPELVNDIEIDGGAQGYERSLQQLVGLANGYGANDSEYDLPIRPVYNGDGYLFDGNRDTADGKTLRLQSDGSNHLTLQPSGATSDLDWVITSLSTADLEVTGTARIQTLHVLGTTDLDSTLNVDGAATLQTTLHVVGAATFDGAMTLGDTSGDPITVNGTMTAGTLTVTTAFTSTGSNVFGNADADTGTAIGVWTFRNAANTTRQLLIDAGNNRVTAGGTTTVMSSDVTPCLQVIGRLYVAPETANDFAVEIRRSAAATDGFTIGITSTNDLVFKDDGDNEVGRFGDASSTYQLLVTGKAHVTGTSLFDGAVTCGTNVTLSSGVLSAPGASVTANGISIKGGLNIDSNGVVLFLATNVTTAAAGARTLDGYALVSVNGNLRYIPYYQ